MRIHSDILTEGDIHEATKARGMRGVYAEVTTHGSRKRARGLEVKLTGNSPHRPNSGRSGADSDDYAAQWDEWGIFLEALYQMDPDMVSPYYTDHENFRWQTAYRFDGLTAPYTHKRHNWKYEGVPRENQCDCGATRRW